MGRWTIFVRELRKRPFELLWDIPVSALVGLGLHKFIVLVIESIHATALPSNISNSAAAVPIPMTEINTISIIASCCASLYVLSSRVITERLRIGEPYYGLLEILHRHDVKISVSNVDRVGKVVFHLSEGNNNLGSTFDSIIQKRDKLNSSRHKAILSIMSSNLFEKKHADAVDTIIEYTDFSDGKLSLISEILRIDLKPVYAEEIFLKWLSGAKVRVKDEVMRLLSDTGTHPLWELSHIREQGEEETRRRVTDICLHLVKQSVSSEQEPKQNSFFATETLPPSEMAAFGGEHRFRHDLKKILDEYNVVVRFRILIISHRHLSLELDGEEPSNAMKEYIKWHKDSNTQFRVMVYKGNDIPENSTALKQAKAPPLLNFALFNDSLIFAQHTHNKLVSIFVNNEGEDYGHGGSLYTHFKQKVSGLSDNIQSIDNNTYLSSDIESEENFVQFVTFIDEKYNREDSTNEETPASEGAPLWATCVFATPSYCPATHLSEERGA